MHRLRCYFVSLIVSAFVLTLAGCGWHLKGIAKMPQPLQQIYIKSKTPNNPLIILLARTLEANHAEVVSSPKAAKAILVIEHIDKSNRLTSISGGAEAGQYTVNLKVVYKVLTPMGKVLLGQTTSQNSQTYTSNATQALSGLSNAQTLTDSLQRSVVDDMLSRLSSIKPAS